MESWYETTQACGVDATSLCPFVLGFLLGIPLGFLAAPVGTFMDCPACMGVPCGEAREGVRAKRAHREAVGCVGAAVVVVVAPPPLAVQRAVGDDLQGRRGAGSREAGEN